MRSYTTSQNAALLVLRLIIATIFFHAGFAKWFLWSTGPMEGFPTWLYYVSLLLSIAEPLGAAAVLVGLLTRAAATGLSIVMIGSIPVSHWVMGAPFFTGPQAPGWDANLMILGGCLALVAFGAGAWSLDAVRRNRRTGRQAADTAAPAVG
jgi:putative oxidoreductase